jgi:hypothetical protein
MPLRNVQRTTATTSFMGQDHLTIQLVSGRRSL